MTDLNLEMFVRKDDKDNLNEALIASRIKAARIVTHLQTSGTHWTLTAKPDNHK